jgi:hypothetical protein
MSLSHSFNTIAGGQNTAGSGGVGGNDYPAGNVYHRQAPSTTVDVDYFAFRQDSVSSVDVNVDFDFYYDTIGGGLTVMTTDDGSNANGDTTTKDFDAFTTAGVAQAFGTNGSKIHYFNDSAISGQTYPGPADQIKIKHTMSTVQTVGNGAHSFSMQEYHYNGASSGAPQSLGTYTNDTWFSLHNIGGQSGIDVPNDSVGIKVNINNDASAQAGGTEDSRKWTIHEIECWVKAIGSYDDTLLYKAEISVAAYASASY